MWFSELYKKDGGIYIRQIMLDKRRVKERINIPNDDASDEIKNDKRYHMANFVLILNDGEIKFGR